MKEDYTPPDQVRINGRRVWERRQRGASMNKYKNGEFAKLILEYLPSFCWMTVLEFLTMLEYVDDSVEFNNLALTIWRLIRQGKIEKRKFTKERKNGFQIRKVEGF